jgi:hypothetical protein
LIETLQICLVNENIATDSNTNDSSKMLKRLISFFIE